MEIIKKYINLRGSPTETNMGLPNEKSTGLPREESMGLPQTLKSDFLWGYPHPKICCTDCPYGQAGKLGFHKNMKII